MTELKTDGSLADLPPSAKLVATTLEHEGTMTQSQLSDETRLAPRTVRSALEKLEESGIVSSRRAVTDARKRVYTLETDGFGVS